MNVLREIASCILTILIGVLFGGLLSVLNIISLGCLQLCQYKEELLLEFYYFIPLLLFLVGNSLFFKKLKYSGYKTTAVCIELLVLCGNIWFLLSEPWLLSSVKNVTTEIIYAIVYYICILCSLIFPLFFCIKLMHQ